MTENPGKWDSMIVVGRVARAHGNRGQVIVNLETDFPEDRFQQGQTLYINSGGLTKACRIIGVRFQSGRPVLSLEGVETISQATVLSQQEFRVPEAALPALSDGTYYRHDLIGCKVSMVTGSNVGTVVDVRGKSGVNRLVVKPFEAKKTSNGLQMDDDEIEVPLVDQICISVDPKRSMIVIDPPDGLLDLNRRS